jgi:3-isopropylmalate/(R)-2-methylmalate dehydratase small subunit
VTTTTAAGTDSGLVFTGRAWVLGDNVPTDEIVPTHWVFSPMDEIKKHALENLKPEFAPGVQPGDIIVAGHHFGQSSGRAVAPKVLQAVGVACIVADGFARTFLRNAFEIGLPILELHGAGTFAADGDQVTADVVSGQVRNVTQDRTAQGEPTSDFLLTMLRAGGLIPLVRSTGSRLGIDG